MPGGVEDPAVVVGEHDDAAAAVGIGGELFEFGARQPAQALVALAHFEQAAFGHRLDRGCIAFRQTEAAAALPRAQDRLRQFAGADRIAAFEERTAGVGEFVDGARAGHGGSCVAFCDSRGGGCSDKQHTKPRRARGCLLCVATCNDATARGIWNSSLLRRSTGKLAPALR